MHKKIMGLSFIVFSLGSFLCSERAKREMVRPLWKEDDSVQHDFPRGAREPFSVHGFPGAQKKLNTPVGKAAQTMMSGMRSYREAIESKDKGAAESAINNLERNFDAWKTAAMDEVATL